MRSTCVSKKRNKAAKARKRFHKRMGVLRSIGNSDSYVPEDAHIEYYANLPEEDLPDLSVEIEHSEETSNTPKPVLHGNRIVSIAYFIEQVRKLAIHDLSCTMGKMNFCGESRNGLISHLTYNCVVCDRTIELTTQNCNTDLNRSFVWGISSIGAGYSQGEELFSLLDVPIMLNKSYKKEEKRVQTDWEALLFRQMHATAMEEKNLAIEEGRIEHGIPYISVIVDGGWAKTSYGHSFSSLSGVACIIGQKTKKLLYIGVKNKFCYVCATTKREHQCFRNYTGSSTAMEQTIIVEGFNSSEADYGIRYKYVIGDGDSSVYTRILENVTYGRYVIKLECANHATRAFTSNLYKLSKNTNYDVAARNIIKSKIASFSTLVRIIIARTPNVNNLRIDLRNSVKHIFGDHENCRKEVCTKATVQSENSVPLLESANVFCELIKICDNVLRKADRLSQNVTTNHAERYMSVIAKFTGGKRTNFVQRGIYRTRCIGAGLSYNSGIAFHKLSTKLNKQFLNKFCSKRQKRKIFRKKSKRPKSTKTIHQEDMDYGKSAAQPDLDPGEFETSKINIMADINNVDIPATERSTVGQRENIEWHQARRNRLTASSFGKICLRRCTTPSHNLLKELFYRNLNLTTKAIQYGIENEKHAIKKFETIFGVKVNDCGIFICKDYCFLGASPDGITENDELLEVKCLYSIKNKTIKEEVTENKKLCVQLNADDELSIKQNHHYFFQIQGQLNICEKEKCYLILYTDIDVAIIKIKRDQSFWQNTMLPKLIKFWEECALPELADPRIPRGLKTRDVF